MLKGSLRLSDIGHREKFGCLYLFGKLAPRHSNSRQDIRHSGDIPQRSATRAGVGLHSGAQGSMELHHIITHDSALNRQVRRKRLHFRWEGSSTPRAETYHRRGGRSRDRTRAPQSATPKSGSLRYALRRRRRRTSHREAWYSSQRGAEARPRDRTTEACANFAPLLPPQACTRVVQRLLFGTI